MSLGACAQQLHNEGDGEDDGEDEGEDDDDEDHRHHDDAQ